MTLTQATAHIKSGTHWTLVMRYEDGEFGCLEGRSRAAEKIHVEQEPFVIGYYWPNQWRYLRKDVERRDPAWRAAA